VKIIYAPIEDSSFLAGLFGINLHFKYIIKSMIQIQVFTFSPVQENTYVLYNEHKNAIIIDPGCYFTAEEETLKAFIDDNGLKAVQLINTHCHLDHVFGNKWVHKTFNLIPTIHKDEEQMLQLAPIAAERWGLPFDNYKGDVNNISEGDIVTLDEDVFTVIAAPGHSPGHICLYNQKQGFIIGGDVLFFESVGRTDLPFCNHEDLMKNIKEKLFTLPNETIVYSGHGQTTTIGYEKQHNPFVN
jgi:glyoxylase-like metal-dependent hydrolase (beta-lactamase superfamily II)